MGVCGLISCRQSLARRVDAWVVHSFAFLCIFLGSNRRTLFNKAILHKKREKDGETTRKPLLAKTALS